MPAPSIESQIAEITGGNEFGNVDTLTPEDLKPAPVTQDDGNQDPPDDDNNVAQGVEPEEPEETPEEPEEAAATEPDENAVIGKKMIEDFLSGDSEAASTVKTLFQAMTPTAQREFLQSLAVDEDPQVPDDEEWGTLKPVYKDLKSLPEFKQSAQKEFARHADYINQAHVGMAALEAVAKVLCERAGVKMPDLDIPALAKNVAKGGYKEAIKPFTDALTKSATKAKQMNKERPAGTRSTSAGNPTLPPNASLMDMIRLAQQRLPE